MRSPTPPESADQVEPVTIERRARMSNPSKHEKHNEKDAHNPGYYSADQIQSVGKNLSRHRIALAPFLETDSFSFSGFVFFSCESFERSKPCPFCTFGLG
jgi:hypothetical protein